MKQQKYVPDEVYEEFRFWVRDFRVGKIVYKNEN